jgi:hypothetical protein
MSKSTRDRAEDIQQSTGDRAKDMPESTGDRAEDMQQRTGDRAKDMPKSTKSTGGRARTSGIKIRLQQTELRSNLENSELSISAFAEKIPQALAGLNSCLV